MIGSIIKEHRIPLFETAYFYFQQKFTMKLIYYFALTAVICLHSCSEGSKDSGSMELHQEGTSDISNEKKTVGSKIDFSNLEQYYSIDSIFSFVAPVGFFSYTKNGLVAKDADFKIAFSELSQYYPCDPNENLLSVKSIFEDSSRGIKVTYKSVKSDGFAVSGYDADGRIVYEKCDYAEFFSMRGRDEGEPSHVWSKAGLIRFNYSVEKKADFNRVVEIIVNSLRVDHDMM
jgi:hypothetical protein